MRLKTNEPGQKTFDLFHNHTNRLTTSLLIECLEPIAEAHLKIINVRHIGVPPPSPADLLVGVGVPKSKGQVECSLHADPGRWAMSFRPSAALVRLAAWDERFMQIEEYGARFGQTWISKRQSREARGTLWVRGMGRTSHCVRAVTA